MKHGDMKKIEVLDVEVFTRDHISIRCSRSQAKVLEYLRGNVLSDRAN